MMGGAVAGESLLVLPLAAGIAALFMSIVVLFGGTKKQRYSFTLFGFSMAIWGIAIALFLATAELFASQFLATLYYVAALGIISGFYAYIVSIGGSKKVLPWFIAPSVVLAAACTIPGWLVSMTAKASGLVVWLNPFTYSAYALWYIIISLFALASLYGLVRDASRHSKEKHQLVALLTVMIICLPLGMVFNLLLPALGDYSKIAIGPIFVIPIVVTVFYSIIQHKLFDIRQAFVRTSAYIATIGVMAAIYSIVLAIVSRAIFSFSTSLTQSVFNSILVLTLVVIFQPIKHFFDRVTDSIFYRDQYHTGEFYSRISSVLTTTTDLRHLLERAAKEIASTLKAEQAFFYIEYSDAHHIAAGTSHHANLPQDDIDLLDHMVRAGQSDLIVAEQVVSQQSLHRLLVSHNISMLMPLLREDKVLGYLALGAHRTSDYDSRDRQVLRTISDELVIAIQNALSVQAVRDTNAHLEQKILAATAELRTSNARLKRLDASKDEFVSMASHQLRTPLTSVKGYISMVLEGDAGRITKAQRELLSEAFTSSERMVHLIHDFLNVSRLQTGKFALEMRDYDLEQLVSSEVDGLKQVAASRDMHLEFKDSAGPTPLLLDETKIRQVVMNYIDNAIYYSPVGSPIEVCIDKLSDEVVVSIKDRGIGVPKAEQARLFGKFYRASNARRQRPDGTGVGLFLAQKVISAHDGDVFFKNREGGGSIFGFRLPLPRPETLENQPDQLNDSPAKQ